MNSVKRVAYLGNDKRNWMLYDPSGFAPTLMAGGVPNKERNTHQSTHKIWIVTFKEDYENYATKRS